jgi:hypothetical protein
MSAETTNDTLARLVRHAGPRQWVMWECECDALCHELVALTLREFDERRAGGQSVVTTAHAGSRAA